MPPIKLKRLYAKKNKTGDFVIVAEPLPAAVTASWSDAQHIERRKAERAAIDAEWKRLGSRT
jgi:hypothetical protein